MDNNLPWIEKYRPCNITEIKGHVDIIEVLKRYQNISCMPHLLFYGPPGSGKTSTILAMAKEFYGESFQAMVMEINASDERGIGVVTGKIKSFVQTRPLVGHQVKLVLLDEADALTVEAQSALRRIIEKNTKLARFCLCCNYSDKILNPLQSRCTKFRFSGIGDKYMKEKVHEIVRSENISIDESAIESIIEISSGDARKVINLLQSVHLGLGQTARITSDDIYRVAGCPLPSDITLVYDSLSKDSFKGSFELIKDMATTKGYAMTDVVTKISQKILESDKINNPVFMDEFSNIEYNLAEGGNELLAIGHLVSCFHQ